MRMWHSHLSSDLDTKFRDVPYDRRHQEIYRELTNQDWSPFNGRTNATVFIFSMAYAFSNGIKPLELGSDALKLPPYAFDTQMRTLMRSLAMHLKGNVHVVKDNNAVIKICSEYANAAVGEVYRRIREKEQQFTSENILEQIIDEARTKSQ